MKVLPWAIVILLVIGTSHGCTEGEYWKDVCRDCRCMNGLATCTTQLCPGEEDAVSQASGSTSTGCTPGDKWREDCNECICDNFGQPECSRRLCA